MKLPIVYAELQEIKTAMSDRRHQEWVRLYGQSNKTEAKWAELHDKLYNPDIKLGESFKADLNIPVMGNEGSIAVCTSIINKLQVLEDELQAHMTTYAEAGDKTYSKEELSRMNLIELCAVASRQRKLSLESIIQMILEEKA